MSKKFALTILLLVCLTLAGAHEFWMQPEKFFFKKGERLELSFKVGDAFIGEPWNLERDRLEALVLYRNTTSVNLRDSVKEGLKNHLSALLDKEGTHLMAMQSTNAFLEMTADEFNAYLKEDGLDEVLDQRKNTNTLSVPGKEYYSRHAKLLFQVGTKPDDTYKKMLGFPVEIVPEKNPYALKVGDAVRFKILFDGKPTFGVRAKVWNRFENRTTIQNIYTEKDGTFEARISNPGPWMVS